MSDVGGESGYVNVRALLQPGIGNTNAEATATRHSLVGKKGDLSVELHYGDFGTGHGRQAALYICRTHRGGSNGVYIPLSTMWMYLQRESLDVMIPPLAKHLYGFVTHMDQIRVLDAVVDYLDDLRKSPPDPNLWKDKDLDSFRESCAEEGLDFFVDVNGTRILS